MLSGAGLLALLAVVAVASRAHKPGGGRSGGGAKVPPVLLEYLGVLAMVTILVGGAVAVFAMADNRRKKKLAGETGWRRSLGGVAFGLLALVFVLLLSRHAHRHNAAPLFGAFGPTGVSRGVTGTAAARAAAHRQQGESDWLGAVVLGSILLGLAAAIASAAAYRRSYGGQLHEEAALAAALDAVLADTLADLYAERDPRTAVINAYARMEQTFAAYRVPRDDAETSLEYVERALDHLNVSGWAVRRLTSLFERAKYSSHDVDTSMKDDAIETLASVRAELEADHEAAA